MTHRFHRRNPIGLALALSAFTTSAALLQAQAPRAGTAIAPIGPNPRYDGLVVATERKLKSVRFLIDQYRETYGRWPLSLKDLTCEGSTDPYCVEQIPNDRLVDGWGNRLVYLPGSSQYVIMSYGSDGIEGGGGTAEDIMMRGPEIR